MNMKYIIAVDLGGTITKVGLLRNGELVDYVKCLLVKIWI